MIKKLLLICVVLVAGAVTTGCSKVEAGHVGVLVNLLGSDKGVQSQEVGVGRYWLTPNEELYIFPTFNQLHTYEQPFNFQTSDSMSIQAYVGVEYYVNPEKVSTVFQTYRKGVDEITSVNIRQNIADALIKHSGKMNINTLAGDGRSVLLDNVTNDLKAKLEPIGINIVKLSWTQDLEYPPQVIESINQKIQASQKALLRENEIQQSKAEAQKAIEEAKGVAESAIIRAKAEADAISLKGDALRKNPEVLNLEAINKWDGKVPVYMTDGAQTPLITIPNGGNK